MKKEFILTLLSAALFVFMSAVPDQARAANCAKNPDHPQCPDGGGDGSGNEKMPVTITFVNTTVNRSVGSVTTRLYSDDDQPYIDDGAADEEEAFIGSQAKEGDILLKLFSPTRRLGMDFGLAHTDPAFQVDFTDHPDCDLGNGDFYLQNLEVNASEGILDGEATQQGVYNLGSGDSVIVSMKLHFRPDPDGDLYMLLFGGDGARTGCGSGDFPSHDVKVTEQEDLPERWKVENADTQQGSYACLQKHGSGRIKTKFCGVYYMPFEFTAVPLPPE